MPGALVTALVAIGVHPVRARVQRGVDRLIHGEAVEPLGVVRGVGHRISAAEDAADALTGVAQSLTDLLRLGACDIEVDARTRQPPTVASPGRWAHRWCCRCAGANGRSAGWSPGRARGERLDGRTRAALVDLLPLVSAAASLAATGRALAGSRSRLAEAREEERRKLRRDLHDGLGPALAGVALGLQAARNLLTADPAAAGQLLDRLREETDQRVEQVRDLARGLLPPVLGERGLTPALHELARRYDGSGLAVLVDAAPLPLPEPVATAVYGIVSEAVRNAHRHSGAMLCRVDVARDAAGLTVRVTDDGKGVTPGTPAGVGMLSMRERAEGIGGVCVVGPGEPGGTRVTVRVPADRLPPVEPDAPAGEPVVALAAPAGVGAGEDRALAVRP
ncbi:hypothetical protein JNW89_24915 [Micromonospora sp. 4G55]|nr:hypothetical protein [Micromonospora sp. 4G55]